jgi:hypothetical protein
MGKEAETIKDENRHKGESRQGAFPKGNYEEETDSEEGERDLIRDPSLGRIVDISG